MATKPNPAVMTKSQQEYAMNRLDNLERQRVSQARAKLNFPTPVDESFMRKVELIRTGKAKLLPSEELSTHTDLRYAYTYPTIEAELVAFRKAYDAAEKKLLPIVAQIEAEAQALRDQIMLGMNAPEVLALLEKFAKAK